MRWQPAKVELARKRLGHSSYGWELALSTPTFPGYGIDAAFMETDQRFWLLKCAEMQRAGGAWRIYSSSITAAPVTPGPRSVLSKEDRDQKRLCA